MNPYISTYLNSKYNTNSDKEINFYSNNSNDIQKSRHDIQTDRPYSANRSNLLYDVNKRANRDKLEYDLNTFNTEKERDINNSFYKIKANSCVRKKLGTSSNTQRLLEEVQLKINNLITNNEKKIDILENRKYDQPQNLKDKNIFNKPLYTKKSDLLEKTKEYLNSCGSKIHDKEKNLISDKHNNISDVNKIRESNNNLDNFYQHTIEVKKLKEEIKLLKKNYPFNINKDKIILHKSYCINSDNNFALISDDNSKVFTWVNISNEENSKLKKHIHEVPNLKLIENEYFKISQNEFESNSFKNKDDRLKEKNHKQVNKYDYSKFD